MEKFELNSALDDSASGHPDPPMLQMGQYRQAGCPKWFSRFSMHCRHELNGYETRCPEQEVGAAQNQIRTSITQ